MSNGARCNCPRCTIRSLAGPAVVITIGVLFLLHEARDGAFDFSNTYPFILIVVGVILLASAMAPMTGHVDASSAPGTSGAAPGPTSGPGR